MSFISGSSSSNSNPAASASGSKDKDDDSTITSSLHSMAASGNEGDEGKKNTPHYHFIHSMILPSTIKIQRELKSRKFKEVQDKLTETIELLQKFQLELWTPEKPPAAKSQNNISDEATTATEMTEDTADDESAPGTNPMKIDEIEDDPLTRMKVHKAVSVAMEAYLMTIAHPLMARTLSKVACEQALACIEQLIIREYCGGRAGGRDDDSASGSAAVAARARNQTDGDISDASQTHRLLGALHDCSNSVLKMPEIHSHISQCIRAILTSPRCSIHESSMLFGIRIVFHSYLVGTHENCRKAAKEALLDIVEYYLQRLELDKARGPSSLWYTDCFYMMRSFIKLSSKEIQGIDETTSTVTIQKPTSFWQTASTADPVALHNKILSLELQRRAIECAGPGFCNGEKFIQLIQSQNGSIALFKNCMSQCTQVAYISQQVFLIMCYKFKHHIKDEMQAFMSNIFFRVLDSQNSDSAQKALVLESLRSLCKDPFLLSQIFLNYDCDMDSENLYKDIVFHLAQLCAKSTIASAEAEAKGGRSKLKEADENAGLCLAGCEVMVTILRSFLEALNIQTNDEDEEEIIDAAGKKIRKDLNIEDIVASVKRRSSTFVRFRQTKNKADVVKSSVLGGATSIKSDEDTQKEGEDDLTGTILGFFEKKRNAEQNLELGVVKFTMDLKKGLRFFIDNGFVSCDANEIARFFVDNKDRLDKTQMGEVLGREPDAAFIKGQLNLDPDKGGPGFFCRILHYYANALDFTGMFFAEGIRLFLSGFRLPGEAQKIDRIMEKFAERFTLQNPDVFPSADTAFILAFSVIMLNTDLHNPSIKEERRMTTDSFIRNNRGIGLDGADLDPAFLTNIFNDIKANPFSLKEDDAAREKAGAETANSLLGDNGGLLGAGLFGITTEEKKKAKFRKERDDMVSTTELLIRRKKGKATKAENLTDIVDPAHVIKPMFDVTWGAIIGTLSQVMECSNDQQAISVCLTGFVYAIRISAHSNMPLARDTFLGSLAKFTYLGSAKELKYKNIEIIRTLINIAVTDGEYLGESWGPVLQCISQLARMRMSASGLDNDETFLQESTHSGGSVIAKKDAGTTNRSMFARETKADVLKETETTNSRIVLNAISEQLIDQVFSSSVNLSAKSLALFIEQLITVANSEIEGDSKAGITGVSTSNTGSSHREAGPSIFSMQRLVDVADYNMHARPRLVWSQIWGLMSGFFSKNGCHKNPMVSVFAVDALKQLSLKFLEKQEASEFHFQRLFLEPFLLIMKNKNSLDETREMVLACVDQMIHSRVDNLKSGWRIFFDIIMVGANDRNKNISLHALNILQGTLDKHMDQLSFAQRDEMDSGKTNRNADAEDFLAMCKASLSFVNSQKNRAPHPIGVSMRALCHVAIYADLIANKRILPPVSGAQSDDSEAQGYTYEGLGEGEEALEMVLWRPLLEGLAKGAKTISKRHVDGMGNFVQRSSVLALRAILLRHGSSFSDNQLRVVLTDTILPAFETALKNDDSPVVSIASESPSISSLDFLVDPFPLPPECDDDSLLKFEHASQHSDRNPRSMGPAELLLEATFTVMRNGGGGDLSEAYKFAKKDMESKEDAEQPFPDSWISTTAPIALGTLTDISSEILFARGAEGAKIWRSTVGATYLRWCNGDITTWVPCEAVVRISTSELNRFMNRVTRLIPTIAEKEDANAWGNQLIEFYTEVMGRNLGFAKDMLDMLLDSKCPTLNNSNEMRSSPSGSPRNSNITLSSPSSPPQSEENEASPDAVHENEVSSALEVSNENDASPASEVSYENAASSSSGEHDEGESSSSEASNESSPSSEIEIENWVSLETPKENEETSEITEHSEIKIESELETSKDVEDIEEETLTPTQIEDNEDILETKLAIGIAKVDVRTLYPSNADKADKLPVETFAKLDERYNTPDSPDWMKLLPALKLRCVAAHYLQQILLSLREEELIGFVSHETVSNLLNILNASRDFAEDAAKNEHLAHAFQEAIFSEWGISDEMGEEDLENIARLNHTQGSAMFFLTQTAGATNGVNRLLTALYDHEETFHGEDHWDRRIFAGQYLVAIMEDIFRKFAESEAKEGHKVDPNVWRNSSESGVKVAIYCTSFASVVVGLLRAMISFEPALIERNKEVFYPLVCELVGVRSEEIRKLVRRVLTEKFGPMLGLGQDTGGRRPIRSSLEGATDHGV